MSGTLFGKGKTLCVLIGDVSYEYTMELMRGMNDTARHYGSQLFYMTGKQNHLPPDNQSSEQEIVSRYNSIYDYAHLVGADAYIISSGSLSGLGSEEEYQLFLDRFAYAPYVLLQKEVRENTAGKCSITIDNHYIFSRCIEHLDSRPRIYQHCLCIRPQAASRSPGTRTGVLRYHGQVQLAGQRAQGGIRRSVRLCGKAGGAAAG